MGVAILFADGVAHDGSAGCGGSGRVEAEDGLGSMSADVWSEVTASAGFESGFEISSELFVVGIGVKSFWIGREVEQVLDDGDEEAWDEDVSFLTLFCFDTCTDDALVLDVEHLFAEFKELTGHHGGIDHQEDITGEGVT